MSHNYRNFIFILYTAEIVKFILINDLVILIVDLEVEHTGIVL